MSKVECTHCHLDFDESVMIADEEHYFCCTGCQGVYHLLSDSGLDNFYDKLGKQKLSAPSHTFEDSSSFDTSSFYELFVKKNEDGFEEISLVIEGIHCSACVWLNEKAINKLEGVVEVNINYATSKAKLVWADHIIKLSAIIDMIRAIGYNAYPYDPSIQEEKANKERKDFYLRIVVAFFGAMNIMWIAIAQYAGYFTGMDQEMKTILNVAEWILATPVLFYSGWIFFKGAYFGFKNKIVNMDILVATGASLTYIYSIYITLFGDGEAYFDSVAMIITFVLVGKFLEVLSKKSAADTMDLISKHIPNEVNIIKEGVVERISVHEVSVGDTIEIKPGEKAALDGEVLEGEGYFDEASLSGESHPILKKPGERIVSGTICVDTLFRYKVQKDFSHSTLSKLVSMLENAMSKKPSIEMLANKISGVFSSVVLGLSFLTFLVWWSWPHSFDRSFMVAISVIVIACPCALALATPVATLIGLSLGGKRGILFKEAAMLEVMAKADMLIVDKTGTITEGKPTVVKVEVLNEVNQALLLGVCESSLHPIAQGLASYLKKENETLTPLKLSSSKQVPSRGIEAVYEGQKVLGGNAEFMREAGIKVEVSSPYSLFFFAVDNKLISYYELRDKPKEGVEELLDMCKENKIEVVMLTGDHEDAAESIAKEVGITNFHAGLSPEQKAEYVSKHQDKVRVMVGDGVNDVLALAHANIGIAMGSGSDIAIEVSDVVLLNDSLKSLKEAFLISRRTFFLVKQNLAISLVYNLITIPLAMAGYIIPLIAAASMSFSSLLVVGNSLRIKYKWSK
ncbi:MAG: heavy metal translocating P-type ATPase [Arcobacter sp.]|nr:MAG: heavy metal translocating P-type ATPase [Arcobacter sp.]